MTLIFMWLGLISGFAMIIAGAWPKKRNHYLKAPDRACKRSGPECVP